MNRTYLLLGSNQGNRLRHLQEAIRRIGRKAGRIQRQSAVYITAAWGLTSQPDFLNQVLVVDTRLPPGELLHCLLGIEKEMGRIRTFKNAPRVIDIDILFYGHCCLHTKELDIPHPRIAERRFVLVPLNEIAPGLKHPEKGQTIHELLRVCTDPLNVKKFSAAGE